jgi:hypothetical protein
LVHDGGGEGQRFKIFSVVVHTGYNKLVRL